MVGVWGNSVVDARGVRSLPIFGAGSGSSPHVRKQKNARLDVRASAREPDRICLLRERRTAALNVDAERMLIGASLRASKRLRSTRPPLSAATLSWRASAGPSRGTLSCCHGRHTEHHRAVHSCCAACCVPYLGRCTSNVRFPAEIHRHPRRAGARLPRHRSAPRRSTRRRSTAVVNRTIELSA